LDFSFIVSAISGIPNLNEIILFDPFGLPSDKPESLQEKALLPIDSNQGKEGIDVPTQFDHCRVFFFAVVAANTKLEKQLG
jgi:hypothetical protein